MNEYTFIGAPDGRFELLIDDPDIVGMPVISFAGPLAEGIGQVTPDLPRELRPDDVMTLCVKTANGIDPIPVGWNELMDTVGKDGIYSSFYRRATGVETAPTITARSLKEHIMAQIVTSRPRA